MSKHKHKSLFVRQYSSWFTSRIYIILFLIVERLPLKPAYKLGRFFGGLLFYLSSYRRKIVEDNVQTLKAWATKRALKNPLLEQENRVIAKEIYQSNAGNFFYSFSMMNKPIATVLKHLKIKDAELLKKAHEKNKGVIVLFSHSGPWELSAILPELIPMAIERRTVCIMYRPLNNHYFNKWYLRKRGRYGAQLLSSDDGFFKITRLLKRGSFMQIAYDIRMQQGLEVELFDRLASTSKIPYVLHKASKAPVIAVNLVRSGELAWEIQFKEIASAENGVCPEITLLKAANEHLEQIIFNNPYDYFFFQDRYK
jgi:lauroyl/myristoyl acyltransferase